MKRAWLISALLLLVTTPGVAAGTLDGATTETVENETATTTQEATDSTATTDAIVEDDETADADASTLADDTSTTDELEEVEDAPDALDAPDTVQAPGDDQVDDAPELSPADEVGDARMPGETTRLIDPRTADTENNRDAQSPLCEEGPPGTYVCQRPPTCETVFRGDRGCQPPEPCTIRSDGYLECKVHQARQPATNQPAESPFAAAGTSPEPVDAASAVDLRSALRGQTAAAMADVRTEIDELRMRYHEGLDTLRDRYEAGKERLRASYRTCLSDAPAAVCGEQARARLSMLRASLQDEGQVLREQLLHEADAASQDACRSLARGYVAILHAHDRAPAALATLTHPGDLALCRHLHPNATGTSAVTR